MGTVENNPNVDLLDGYSKDDWVDFLKQGAYRGLKINKIARHLGKSKSCKYDKTTHSLELIYGKSKTITIDMAKLLKKNERWTLSRLIHNIKMCFSKSDYAFDFDVRITKLAEAITKKTVSGFSTELDTFVAGDHDLSEITTVFNHNLGVINQSTGDKDIKDKLLKLSAQAFEKANDPRSRLLAFQIQCTAQAMVPDPNLSWEVLPLDIQKLLFSKVYQNEGSIKHPLNLVSKQLNDNALNVNKNWSEKADIDLKTEGCKTAKEAISYITDHNLTTANLLDFPDLVDEDLEELSQNCPQIKTLIILPKKISCSKLVKAMRNFTDLKSLGLSYCHISGEQLVEIAKMHPYLKHLDIHKCDKISDDKLMEAIHELTDLKSLRVGGYESNIKADPLIKIAKMRPHLTNLDIGTISGDPVLEIARLLPNLQVFEYGKVSSDLSIEIAKRLPNLKNLEFSYHHCMPSADQIMVIARLLPNLQSLALEGGRISGVQLIEIASMFPNLRDLYLNDFYSIKDDQILDIVNLLPHLRCLGVSGKDISGDAIVKLAKMRPNLEFLHISRPTLSGDQLVEITKLLPLLKYLYIGDSKTINQDKLNEALLYLPKLDLQPPR